MAGCVGRVCVNADRRINESQGAAGPGEWGKA